MPVHELAVEASRSGPVTRAICSHGLHGHQVQGHSMPPTPCPKPTHCMEQPASELSHRLNPLPPSAASARILPAGQAALDAVRALGPASLPDSSPGGPRGLQLTGPSGPTAPGAVQDRIHSLAASHRHLGPPQLASGPARFATVTFAVGGVPLLKSWPLAPLGETEHVLGDRPWH